LRSPSRSTTSIIAKPRRNRILPPPRSIRDDRPCPALICRARGSNGRFFGRRNGDARHARLGRKLVAGLLNRWLVPALARWSIRDVLFQPLESSPRRGALLPGLGRQCPHPPAGFDGRGGRFCSPASARSGCLAAGILYTAACLPDYIDGLVATRPIPSQSWAKSSI
jgi:hypothetical protein